jgi:hypothetical protein
VFDIRLPRAIGDYSWLRLKMQTIIPHDDRVIVWTEPILAPRARLPRFLRGFGLSYKPK